MAADLQPEDSGNLLSQINVTPFVDVVLVLLVIFMVTAPMLVKEILEIRLPKTVTSDGQVSTTLGIAVNKDGEILLNGKLIEENLLRTTVQEQLKQVPDLQAVIAADQETAYGKVTHVIDLLKQSGLEKFAVQVDHDETAKSTNSTNSTNSPAETK